MNLLRTLGGSTLLVLTGAVLNGCINAPDYPVKPAIDFKEVRVNRIPAGVQDAVNELTFVLEFRDGDGDLGLSDEDIGMAPYNQPPQPPVPQRNQLTNDKNYFLQPFIKDPITGRFTPFITPPPFGKLGEYDATFIRLDVNQTRPGPLKGELNYKFPISIDGTVYQPGQVFRFEITVMDRALNVSNTVTTSEVTLSL